MYRNCIKRLIDIVLSLLALVILFPVFLVVAGLVRLKLGKPIIFKQKRPGLNEKIFTLYKFRTMIDKYDSNGELLSDDLRLTRFGKLLRSTSLDELPELYNILKGDMSIVGPRPLLVQYLPLYSDLQRKRHMVRPGLTGLAQINGRNSISWEDKFSFDIAYVNKISFMNDLKIILCTIKKVFVKDGINSETAATMEVFLGSDKEVNQDSDNRS